MAVTTPERTSAEAKPASRREDSVAENDVDQRTLPGDKSISGDKTPPADPEKQGDAAAAGKPAAPAPGSPGDFPDGGRQAWLTVAGGWCAMYTSLGWINCIGVFQTIYETNQLKQYSPSTIAWILSLQTFVMFGGAPIFGKIFDSYGPRYLIFFGTLFHVFGLMMTSLCKEYYQFILAQSICSGLGASAIFYSSTNSVATWFKKRRALALGIASSGSATGGVITPIMVHNIYLRVGFGWAVRAVAFVFLGLLVISNFLLQSRLKHTPKRFHVMDFVKPLKEPRFILVSLANFFFFLAVFLPNNYIISYAVSKGMSDRLAFYLLAILNGVSAIGRIVAGRTADKIGRFNCMILVTGLSIIFVLAIWLTSASNAQIIVFAALIGFTSGAFVASVAALIGQISKITEIGTRNGTNFAVISLAALIGNPIAGALIGRDHGGFLYMQIFAGVAMFVSTLLFIAARTVLAGGFNWKVV